MKPDPDRLIDLLEGFDAIQVDGRDYLGDWYDDGSGNPYLEITEATSDGRKIIVHTFTWEDLANAELDWSLLRGVAGHDVAFLETGDYDLEVMPLYETKTEYYLDPNNRGMVLQVKFMKHVQDPMEVFRQMPEDATKQEMFRAGILNIQKHPLFIL